MNRVHVVGCEGGRGGGVRLGAPVEKVEGMGSGWNVRPVEGGEVGKVGRLVVWYSFLAGSAKGRTAVERKGIWAQRR